MQPRNETLYLDVLEPHPKNYNRHPPEQVRRLAKSLTKFGQVRSVVVWRGTLLAGHGVVEAARILNWSTVRADVLPDDYPEHLALAYIAADNELAKQGDPDMAQLAAILEESKAADADLLEAIGYSDKEFEALLKEVGKGAAGVEDAGAQVDRADELRQKWQTAPGQLWQLGEHRLIVGDCTDPATVARVMGGERAALGVTSPPYGVGKDYESGGLEQWKQTVSGMLSCAKTVTDAMVINLGDVKVGPNSREVHSYGLLVELCADAGLPLIGTRVWVKPPAWSQGPYWLSSYRAVDDLEYIGLFGSIPHVDRTTADWRYRGVWEIASVTANKLHSAMFPVELPERLITLLCDPGAIVYEPFDGSGTTIMACENLGRKCRACEIGPAYVAVALERWAMSTGKTPVLVEAA